MDEYNETVSYFQVWIPDWVFKRCYTVSERQGTNYAIFKPLDSPSQGQDNECSMWLTVINSTLSIKVLSNTQDCELQQTAVAEFFSTLKVCSDVQRFTLRLLKSTCPLP